MWCEQWTGEQSEQEQFIYPPETIKNIEFLDPKIGEIGGVVKK